MKTPSQVIVTLAAPTLAIVLLGCTQFRGGRIMLAEDDYQKKYYKKLCKVYENLDDLVNKFDADTGVTQRRTDLPKGGAAAGGAAKPAEKATPAIEQDRKARRNQILNDLIIIGDFNFTEMTSALKNGRETIGFISDVAVLGVTTAGTLTGGAAVKSILSATAAGVTGAKLSVDQNFYREKTTEILIAKMVAERSRLRGVLAVNMAMDPAAYPLRKGIEDVFAYYDAGTMKSALVSLSEEQGPASIKARETLKETLARLGVVTPESEFSSLKEQLMNLPDEDRKKACKEFVAALLKSVGAPANKPFTDLVADQQGQFDLVFKAVDEFRGKVTVEKSAETLARIIAEMRLVLPKSVN